MSKDLFSGHSKLYAAFRPTYPEELYTFVFEHLSNRDTAWDCATGNGQVAIRLARDFRKVFATDISRQQLEHAFASPNVEYSIGKAEETAFPDNAFDLITVGQALHWFNMEKFYREVNRVGRPGALLAVWGYALLNVSEPIDALFIDFYSNNVGMYWDESRRLVEDQYRNIPFPFQEIQAPPFLLTVNWTLDEFSGYISSWSATQKYIRQKGADPVPSFIQKVRDHWHGDGKKQVTFPLFLKLGRIAGTNARR